jgi:hypothetical protein
MTSHRWKPTRRVARLVYELAILKAMVVEGGECSTSLIYGHVERTLQPYLEKNPSERDYYESGESGEQIWRNQVRQAKRDLMQKGQLDGSERDNWKITELGRERLAEYERTGKDPDKAKIVLDDDAVD